MWKRNMKAGWLAESRPASDKRRRIFQAAELWKLHISTAHHPLHKRFQMQAGEALILLQADTVARFNRANFLVLWTWLSQFEFLRGQER
jgi:hypothetical protein